MKNIMLPQQQIQECEYASAYHWKINPETYAGLVYYGYLAIVADRMKRLLMKLGPSPRLIDIGCGDGKSTDYLARATEQDWVGTDFSEDACRLAADRVSPRVTIRQAPSLDVFPDMSFDGATLIEVFEHIPPSGADVFLAGIHRILRPGGFLVLTVPSQNIPLAEKHFRHFTPDLLQREVEKYFFLEETVFQDSLTFRKSFLLARNSYWKIPVLSSFLANIYRMFFNVRRSYRGAGRVIMVLRRK